MSRAPKISICIPVYNGELYLRECLESILQQDFQDMEVIIVDDCSTDHSMEIVEEFRSRDSRFTVYRNTANLGLVANWNKCLGLAKGDWIKFLFQDDLMANDCLQKMIENAGSADILTVRRHFIFDNSVSNQVKDYYQNRLADLRSLKGFGSRLITARDITELVAKYPALNFIGEPTAVMFRRSVVPLVGSFDEHLTQICDLEYWLRIATSTGLLFIDEQLVNFRVHASSVSAGNVLSKPKFRPRYIDTLILSYRLLHNDVFTAFRNNATKAELNRVTLYYETRLLEAQQAVKIHPEVPASFFKWLYSQYPGMEEREPGIIARLAFAMLRIKRKIK